MLHYMGIITKKHWVSALSVLNGAAKLTRNCCSVRACALRERRGAFILELWFQTKNFLVYFKGNLLVGMNGKDGLRHTFWCWRVRSEPSFVLSQMLWILYLGEQVRVDCNSSVWMTKHMSICCQTVVKRTKSVVVRPRMGVLIREF